MRSDYAYSAGENKKSGQMKIRMMLIITLAISCSTLPVTSLAADEAKSDLEGIWDMDGFGQNGHTRNPALTEAGQTRFVGCRPQSLQAVERGAQGQRRGARQIQHSADRTHRQR